MMLEMRKWLATVQVLVITHTTHTITMPQSKDPPKNTSSTVIKATGGIHKHYLGIQFEGITQ